MRLLLLNPNTSQSMTDRMLQTAVAAAHPQTHIKAVTATRGLPYIATRAEAQIGGAILLEMLAEHRAGADVAIVAAFGDPGLIAARELFDIPVIGMAEASMLTACMLGARFSIVTFSPALRPWFSDCVATHGLSTRCASIRTLPHPPKGDVSVVRSEMEDEIVRLACLAVQEDGADVVILGGAPLSGLAARIRDRVPVPLVDQIVASVKQAETLIALDVRPATQGGFGRPAAKSSRGLPDPLADWIAHEDKHPAIAALRPTIAGGNS